ncbi:MAG: hypothetical protein NZM38_02070 [Cytophagales bacterium]|nr:hypothetical protein [Cytophagales bacterium]MDW8383538.1 hypothetical protein [Flammeovirgaceae bacterium]
MYRLFQLSCFILLTGFFSLYAQHYTSATSGNWTTNSNWTGGTAPPISGQTWGTINVNHNMYFLNGVNYNFGGRSF